MKEDELKNYQKRMENQDRILKRLEDEIAIQEEKGFDLQKEILKLRGDKTLSPQQRSMLILEKEIEEAELNLEREDIEFDKKDILNRKMKMQSEYECRDSKISKDEYSQRSSKIQCMTLMLEDLRQIENYQKSIDIYQLKMKLEGYKRNMGLISDIEAQKNIQKLETEIFEVQNRMDFSKKSLTKEKNKYYNKEMYAKANRGEISPEERDSELKKIEKEPAKSNEIESIFEEMQETYLKEDEILQTQNYEKEASNRDREGSFSKVLERNDQFSIEQEHEISAYKSSETLEWAQLLEHDEKGSLGHKYAKLFDNKRNDLLQSFGDLEIERGDAYDKNLLQLEKVDGLEINQILQQGENKTLKLEGEIFIATYEQMEWEDDEKYQPITEYYKKDENGELVKIATKSPEGMKLDTAVSDYYELDGGLPINIKVGKSIDKVTQSEISDKLIKESIEKSVGNGKVTSFARISDVDFIDDFIKQCDNNLTGQYAMPYLVSSINEKGEEDFDILWETGYGKFEAYPGIEKTAQKGRDISSIVTGAPVIKMKAGTIMHEIENNTTLKEFETKSGNRYAITRGKDGKLGFTEITRDNEQTLEGQTIDTYSYSKYDLRRDYEEAEITTENVNHAYQDIKNTKDEREGTKEKEDFEK